MRSRRPRSNRGMWGALLRRKPRRGT